jgi:hypothetical protein
MQAGRMVLGALAAGGMLFAFSAHALSDPTTLNYAVTRDGAPIGTNVVRLGRDGQDTTVQVETHVEVGVAFITFYKFDETETERWADGRLVAMNATTDDNGTVHRASATAQNGMIVARCDGKTSQLLATTIPLNLWNRAIVAQNEALDTQSGSLEPIKVTDRGEDELVIHGHARRAHHYVVVTTFPQDVWYDDKGELVQVELKGSDGSTIRYQLV